MGALRWVLAALLFYVACGETSGGEPRRILVRGYQLLDDIAGGSSEQAFARGYVLAAMDTQSLCPPDTVNAFSLKDEVARELEGRTNDELQLPASMMVAYIHLDWHCPPSGELGHHGDHIDLRGLTESLKGLDTNRSYGEGYIAGTVDGLLDGCSLQSAVSLDEMAGVVAEAIDKRLSYAATFPSMADTSPLPVINRSLVEGGLCK